METFKEQIVVKKTTGKDLAKQIGILGGAAVVVLALAFAMPFTDQFWFFLALAIGFIIYAVFKYFPLFYVEYEYIFTSGDLDIDKITGKQKRKRLATINVETLEEFGKYDEKALEGKTFNTRIFACTTPTAEDTCYLIVDHPRHQHLLLVFNPNDMIKESVLSMVPRTAKIYE